MQEKGFPETALRTDRSRRAIGSVLLWLAAAVVVFPMLLHGPACGIDFIFHFVSWQEALRSWHYGFLYPRWATAPNFGAGEPRFIFYPPITWMFGAALGALLPWVLVPTVFNFLVLGASGLATRALARQILPEWPALLAGCFAIFSGYNLYEMYHHGDFALMFGGLWVPVLLWFWLKGSLAPGPLLGLITDRYVLALTLVLAGTWLSNTPLGLMATYMLSALACLAAFQSRSWAPLARAFLAIGLGLGLAAFYLIPAAREQHWVDILKLFATPDHLIENRWITSELANPKIHLFPSQRIRGVIEGSMLLMALGGLGLAGVRGRWPSKDQKITLQCWLVFGLISCAVLFLMLPISLPVWNLLPRLRYLQYPWRWLVVLQAPMAILFVAGIWPSNDRRRPYAATLCILFFLSVTYAASASRSFYKRCPVSPADPNSVAGLTRALQPGGIGVGGYDEYATPPGARNDLIATHLPDACLVRDPALALSDTPAVGVAALYTPRAWSPGLGTCEREFAFEGAPGWPEHLGLHAVMAHPGFLVLRLRSYPAWNVSVNGNTLHSLPQRLDGLMAVPVPGGPVSLKVDWTNTSDVLLGRWISAGSWSFLLLCGLSRWLPRRSRA